MAEAAENKSSFKFKFFITVGIGIVLFLFLMVGSVFGYNAYYKDRVYPGVRLGGSDVGGMTKKELVGMIENLNNRYAKEGVDLYLKDGVSEKKIKFDLITQSDSAVELIRLDSEKASAEALSFGRRGSYFENLFMPIFFRSSPETIPIPVVGNEDDLKNSLKAALASYEDSPQNAGVKFRATGVDIVPERGGKIFDYDSIVKKMFSHLASLSFGPLYIEKQNFNPTVKTADVRMILPKATGMVGAPIVLTATSTATTTAFEWVMTPEVLSRFVEVKKSEDGNFKFSLNEEAVDKYLDLNVSPMIEVPAQDAKFSIENSRVKEFQGSKEGVRLDKSATYLALNGAFEKRNYEYDAATTTVDAVYEKVVPNLQTANLNDLGIVEIVGAGTSTFKDSHSNRIKNIANAVKRLNGVLIKPGEIFSSNKYAGPYTAENGFLPEQIIKGKEIKYEVGGGMCQIGTTLFRMAMQTGLPITERHNHSLVVNYYADPVNGNPGTDATLYEPLLDLKFENDTGNYLLLQTDIDFKKQMLTFTLWGTKDGRSGSYSRPLVSRWIPAPKETQYVVDPKLPAGKQTCQNAFRGAVASFVYTRMTTSGQKIDREFDSYYRALPKICTIGPSSTPAGTSSTTPSSQAQSSGLEPLPIE